MRTSLLGLLEDRLRANPSLADSSQRSKALQELLLAIEGSRTISKIRSESSKTLLDRPEIKEKVEADIGHILVLAQKERKARIAEIKAKRAQNTVDAKTESTPATKKDDAEDFLSSILARKRPREDPLTRNVKGVKAEPAIKIEIKSEKEPKAETSTPMDLDTKVKVETRSRPTALELSEVKVKAEPKVKMEEPRDEHTPPAKANSDPPMPSPTKAEEDHEDSSELSSLSSSDDSESSSSDDEPTPQPVSKRGVRTRGGVQQKPPPKKGTRTSARRKR